MWIVPIVAAFAVAALYRKPNGSEPAKSDRKESSNAEREGSFEGGCRDSAHDGRRVASVVSRQACEQQVTSPESQPKTQSENTSPISATTDSGQTDVKPANETKE